MRKNSKCSKCIYREKFTGDSENYWMCDYLMRKNKPRPCPAGDNCTVFEPGKKIKKIKDIALPGSPRGGRKREAV